MRTHNTEHLAAFVEIYEFAMHSLYCAWSKEVLEAGKRRLAGRHRTGGYSGEVKELRCQAQELKAVVA